MYGIFKKTGITTGITKVLKSGSESRTERTRRTQRIRYCIVPTGMLLSITRM